MRPRYSYHRALMANRGGLQNRVVSAVWPIFIWFFLAYNSFARVFVVVFFTVLLLVPIADKGGF